MNFDEMMKQKLGTGVDPDTLPITDADLAAGGRYDQNTEAGKLAYTKRMIKDYRAQGNEEQAQVTEQGLPYGEQPDAALDRNWMTITQDRLDWEAVLKKNPTDSGAQSILEVKNKFLADLKAEFDRRGRATPDTSMLVGKDWDGNVQTHG